MKDKNKNQKQSNVMEGYNPYVYSNISVMFIILTVLNIAVVIFSFAKTGFGLWHAEDALSCIAKIDSSFGDINRSLLMVEMEADDSQLVMEYIDDIFESHQTMAYNADEFRKIDLKDVDKTLGDSFETTIAKIEEYYGMISDGLNEVKNGTANPNVFRNPEVDRLQREATEAIDSMFVKQDEATYAFFVRVAQRFLLVPLFLIITMVAGLVMISKAKKRDYEAAVKLISSKKKQENIRQKAVEIAYTNVVTNLKNRYALEEHLDEILKDEDIVIAMYNFNRFRSIHEQYGRSVADEYVANIAQKLVETYGKQAEIYSTEIDEFCVIFDKEMSQSKANEVAQKILRTLSQPTQVQNELMQLTVSACICACDANTYASSRALFMVMDQNLVQIKRMCREQNRSVIVPINNNYVM